MKRAERALGGEEIENRSRCAASALIVVGPEWIGDTEDVSVGFLYDISARFLGIRGGRRWGVRTTK